MALTKTLSATALSLSLVFSPLIAQSAFAQTAPVSTPAPAGGQAAKDAAKGGLSDEAIVGIVVVVGAGIAVAASSGGGSGSGTTGTTGTTTPR